MIYSVALIFNEETNNQIKEFYSTIKNNLDPEFEIQKESMPHATIIKFETPNPLITQDLNEILKNLTSEILVDFSGITFLPSRSKGCWIELPILKTQQLIDIQNKLITRLDKFKILSGIENRFRPHITFAKTRDCSASFKNLNCDILRKKQVKATIVIGSPDETFEFRSFQLSTD